MTMVLPIAGPMVPIVPVMAAMVMTSPAVPIMMAVAPMPAAIVLVFDQFHIRSDRRALDGDGRGLRGYD